MSASTSILDEKAFYGETLGAHSGPKLNLLISDYYDSHAVVFVHEYGIECDMYAGCGALILDNIKTREEALEIMETIQNAGKAEPTFTRSKGGTAEREEIISQIQVPDLWHLAMWLKGLSEHVDTIVEYATTQDREHIEALDKSIQYLARLKDGESQSDLALETWHLAHDMRKHLQSNRCNTEPSKQADWYAPDGEPYLVDCKDCYIVHAIGEGRDGCIDGGETRDRWFTNG